MNKACKKGHFFEGIQCTICLKEYQKQYRLKNKEKAKKYQEKYRKENAKAISETNKKYRKIYNQENKQTIAAKQKDYVKKKSNEDICFRLAKNLRSRTSNALKNKQKAGSAVQDIGCNGLELKNHLESLFKPGMTWENYGNKPGQWSIDHIVPLSKVDLSNREQFLKVSHYTNLQPMWQLENVKKSNKI